MSKSRSSARTSSTAIRRMSAPVYRFSPLSPVLSNLLRSYEDRRAYHPSREYRRSVSLGRVFTSTVSLKRSARIARRHSFLPRDTFRFNIPSRVVICMRRKQRREVLHAEKRVGRGSGGGMRHRNYYSEVSC